MKKLHAERGHGKQGFASLSRERVREIASQGGKAAHQHGAHGHEWTREEAQAAGRKGGQVSQERRAHAHIQHSAKQAVVEKAKERAK